MAVPTTVFSESNGGTPTITDNIASIVFASADSQSGTASLATNSPVAANTNSYEKWLRQKVTGVSTNSISAFGVYFTSGAITDGGGGSTITSKFGVNGTYAAPTASASTVATTLTSTQTAAPGLSFTAPANTLNAYSGYITIQLQLASSQGGNMTFPATWFNTSYTYS